MNINSTGIWRSYINVLADYHQGALFRSLHLLFEKRLGYKLFRPIGNSWFSQGWWRVAEPYGNPEATIGQYLDINEKEWDSHKNLNGNYKLTDNVYRVYDPENDFTHRAITLETFKEMKFDLIVASHPLHEHWENLLQFQPEATFIQQLGNENQTTKEKNILSSVYAYVPEEGQNVQFYHQEFPLPKVSTKKPKRIISSFVLGLEERETFEIYKSNLPEFEFRGYTVEPLGYADDMNKRMNESMFGWHIKMWDGYGHLIHTWAALGKPLIVRGGYYQGKTGGLLIEDGVTCIDLDKHTFDENLERIRHFSQPLQYKKMAENMKKRFKEVCQFDREAMEIKNWLSSIVNGVEGI